MNSVELNKMNNDQKPIRIVHFSDLHFGSGERYGSINPETGFNRRFEDFIYAIDKPINFAIDNEVDLAIFTGDTYKHATPEPLYQKEFAKRIKKLSKNKIPTILLVGNHDVLYRVDGSDSLDIYDTLEIDYVTVFNKIELKNIETKSGMLQVVALPHVTKSRLLTKDEYRNLSNSDQDQLMIKKVKDAILGKINQLNTQLPSVLIGHGTIETAQFGSEQDLSIGKVLSYPLSFFQKEELDYVGFGHIHKHQILQKEKPLILYAGSLERVDFGEEGEDKGFVYLEIEKGKVQYEFRSTSPREFKTIAIDLTGKEDPQPIIEKELNKFDLEGCVVRLRLKIDDEKYSLIDFKKTKELFTKSFAYTIQTEIESKERTFRLPEIDSSLISDPILALDKYLFDIESKEEKDILLDKAKKLMGEAL